MRTSYVVRVNTLAILLFAGLATRPASAQTTYGQIVGNVKDATGAMMVDVRVTVINQGTHETHTQTTNDTGAYAFRTLLPGRYLVRGEMEGFRPIEVDGIVLQVNQTARFDLTLEVVFPPMLSPIRRAERDSPFTLQTGNSLITSRTISR